jgi:serine/threonine protein kinase
MLSELPLPYTVSHYELTSVIGSGAFSTVYRAVDTETSSPWAVKVIPKDSLPDDDARIRLQREITTMAYLVHPNILRLEDFIIDNDNFFLVIEHCSGGDLADFIHNGPPSRERVAASIFSQVISGMQFLHSHGIAHRDLKPQNILLVKNYEVRIADFGLCGFQTARDNGLLTMCGTQVYMAPECLRPGKYDGFARDIWSLGVILFELATTEYPWNINNIPQMFKQIASAQYTIPDWVSTPCRDLIMKMLKVRASDRPTAAEVLESNWFKLGTPRGKMRASSCNTIVTDFAKVIEMECPNSAIVNPFSEGFRRSVQLTRSKEELPRLGTQRGKFEKTAPSPFEVAAKRRIKPIEVGKLGKR